jgi:hypothetical protein
MNDLQELLTCEWCKETLRGTPLILACCNATVCERHVVIETSSTSSSSSSKKRKIFTCDLCEESHQMDAAKRFAPNKTVAKLIEMQIGKLKFGEAHEFAKSGCQFLKEKIDKTNEFLSAPHLYLSAYVKNLKHEAEMRRDELKRDIDKLHEEMCRKLDAYESECMSNLSSLQSSFRTLEESNDETLDMISEWRKELNMLVIDESKWTSIQSKTFFLESQLNGRVDEIKDEVRMNKFWHFKKNAKFIREFGKELKTFGR